MVVATNLHLGNLAEQPFLDDAVARFHEMRRAAALGVHLNDALVLAGGAKHRLALEDIHADRLLHPNIDAGLTRGDHRERVPVIGRLDQHQVEVFFFEHLAIVVVGAGLFLRRLT